MVQVLLRGVDSAEDGLAGFAQRGENGETECRLQLAWFVLLSSSGVDHGLLVMVCVN